MNKREKAIRSQIKLTGVFGDYRVRVGFDSISVAKAELGHEIVRALRMIARNWEADPAAFGINRRLEQ